MLSIHPQARTTPAVRQETTRTRQRPACHPHVQSEVAASVYARSRIINKAQL